MKTLVSRKLSFVFLGIQLVVSILLCGMALYVEFIPNKYVAVLAVVCAVPDADDEIELRHRPYSVRFFLRLLHRRQLLYV